MTAVDEVSEAPTTAKVTMPRSLVPADSLFRVTAFAAAVLVSVILAAIVLLLLEGAWPALSKFGWGFLIDTTWNPVTEVFGAAAPVYGTLMTAAIAMAVGVPLALGVAIFLAEICPHRLRLPLSVAVDLLAAVPSIIYGMWGLFTAAPVMSGTVMPWMIRWLGPLPVVGGLFQGAPYGIGMLTAGLILALMVVPFVSAISRQVLEAVPPVLREAAYAVGATRWEVVAHVLLPTARLGLLGGIMLGLGRALGETMAVTFVIGNAHKINASLIAPATTISATLANEFTEAVGDLYLSSLMGLGLVLLVITLAVLMLARLMLRQMRGKLDV